VRLSARAAEPSPRARPPLARPGPCARARGWQSPAPCTAPCAGRNAGRCTLSDPLHCTLRHESFHGASPTSDARTRPGTHTWMSAAASHPKPTAERRSVPTLPGSCAPRPRRSASPATRGPAAERTGPPHLSLTRLGAGAGRTWTRSRTRTRGAAASAAAPGGGSASSAAACGAAGGGGVSRRWSGWREKGYNYF
jgi:hypothetical protein